MIHTGYTISKCRFPVLAFLFTACFLNGLAQERNVPPIDSAKKSLYANKGDDERFIKTCFFIADSYMDYDLYDSSQVWLNKIHLKLSYRSPSPFSYFLSSRQAEVYYYNNLPQLGLQESRRAVQIASALNDSLMLADSHNFLGLFYMAQDSIEQAIAAFLRGISFSAGGKSGPSYLPLTESHHLYSNLAEAYEKIKAYNMALQYGFLALEKATGSGSGRGMAIGHLNLGNLFLKKNDTAAAHIHYRDAASIAGRSGDVDVELLGLAGQSQCQLLSGRGSAAIAMLRKGFDLMRLSPQLNYYFALQFLQTAAEVYKATGESVLLAETLRQKSALQEYNQEKSNRQMQTILTAGLKNETLLLQMEVTDARQKQQIGSIRFYIIVLLALLLATVFLFYRHYSRHRLRMAQLRNKISQDLHDEVGATLSGIALYSHLSREQIKTRQTEKAESSLELIQNSATQMVSKLNDIVWAVNPLNDGMAGMAERLQEYAAEMAAAKDMQVKLDMDSRIHAVKLPMEQRKNVYLICKEAINNAVKYSGAQTIWLGISVRANRLCLTIADNGKGFDPEQVKKGNGLNNMKLRAAEMNALLSIEKNKEQGTLVRLICRIP
ncbi:MAG TPA: histidine kinase [Flavisolibacter sp.]|nr:histidine kinase [Flavisolibacter sp.]